MANSLDTTTRRRIFLVAAVADLHPETARALVQGKPISRKTRDALVRARENVNEIYAELVVTLDRLAGDAATAPNASGV